MPDPWAVALTVIGVFWLMLVVGWCIDRVLSNGEKDQTIEADDDPPVDLRCCRCPGPCDCGRGV